MSPAEFQELQDKVAKLKQRKDKAAGALDQILSQLKEKYNCENLDEAKELLKELKQKKKKAQAKFDRLLERFEKNWSDKLEDF